MSRRLMSVILICASLTMATSSFAQVRDAAGAAPVAPAPSGTASISGVVMSEDASPRPLRLANVVLIGAMTGVMKMTSTDRDGRFAFSALPADRYTVGASKLPYLGAVVGARRPARPGTPLVIANGQKVSDIIIRLPPGASISGTVTDELGQPAVAQVIVQQRKLQNGERTLVSAGSAVTTDELGRYRIYGLPPGEYVVASHRFSSTISARQLTDRDTDAALGGSPRPTPAAPVASRYVPTYYPGTSRPSDAGGILLKAGEERAAIDMRLEMATTAQVGGIVVTGDGLPVLNATVNLSSVGGPVATSFFNNVGQVGRFSFASVLPGTYVLTATQGGPQGSLFGSLSIEINGDQIGLELVLKPPTTLKGRIVFDGAGPAPQLNGWRPLMRSLSRGPGSALTTTPSDQTGSFSIQRVSPGSYVVDGPASLGANANSVTWSLQSVTADGKDITDRPIDITPDTAPKEIVITFTDKWQGVSGKLQQASGAPATDYAVVIFPADKSYWLTGSRRILTARPDSAGQFTIAGPGVISLPPGEYLLAAVTELDREEQFDPALLASLIGAAVPLSIQPGEKKVQDLVIR